MEIRETAELCLSIRRATHAWAKESDDAFEQIVRVWHDCLKDVPFDMAKKALNEYLVNNTYPPTIADIYRPYKEYLESKKEKNKSLREIYYRTISYFPCYKDTTEMQNEWMRITQNDIGKAERFERVLISYVHECETMGVDPLTFEEYMKGVKQIE